MNPQLVVFAYAFPHKKTFEGLVRLVSAGLRPDLVWAAPRVQLAVPDPKFRLSAGGDDYPPAVDLCRAFDLPLHIGPHRLEDAPRPIQMMRPEVGVILGARVLRGAIVHWCRTGTLNMHPGVLPENRGLDNLKWAVLVDLPQGVTSHLIDESVDRGYSLDLRLADLDPDLSFRDIHQRLFYIEMDSLVPMVERLLLQDVPYRAQRVGAGVYRSSMTREDEVRTLQKLPSYLANYAEITGRYRRKVRCDES